MITDNQNIQHLGYSYKGTSCLRVVPRRAIRLDGAILFQCSQAKKSLFSNRYAWHLYLYIVLPNAKIIASTKNMCLMKINMV